VTRRRRARKPPAGRSRGKARARALELPAAPPAAALCIDTDSDAETKPLFKYRKEQLYPGLAASLTMLAAHGSDATRAQVGPLARDPRVRLITGSGHGTANAFQDGHGRPIFAVGELDPREVSGKIVHLLACQTALQLGPDMITNGGQAFFGYDVDFVFSPFRDLAELFFDADAEIDRSLVSGLTAAAACAAAVERFQEHIDELDRRAAAETNPARKDVLLWTATALEFNRDHLLGPRAAGSPFGDPLAQL
jgi:hypothetical protein